MFSFFKRWNKQQQADDLLPELTSDVFEELPEDDLEAVVGGLANEEQIRRSIQRFNDVIHHPLIDKQAE